MERKQTISGQEKTFAIPMHNMPYRTCTKKKPGFTTPCGMWDGDNCGGILYANDEEYARYLKEREKNDKEGKGIDPGYF